MGKSPRGHHTFESTRPSSTGVVRELKDQTSRILRRVRDRGEEIQVTYRGRTMKTPSPRKPAYRP
jgi:hypothetical protein